VTRRLVQLLILLALATAPFGRIGMVQAAGHHPPMAMAGHCGGQQMPDRDKGHAIDCTIACAAIAQAPAPFLLPPPAPDAAPAARLAAFPPGIHPGADPPPPRFA
jgi:hypothetical protein